MKIGPAEIQDDSVMFQDNQIGDIFENELTLWVSIESVVNNELTLPEVQALVAALPAIRQAIAATSYTQGAADRHSVEVDRITNLPHEYKQWWDAVYG